MRHVDTTRARNVQPKGGIVVSNSKKLAGTEVQKAHARFAHFTAKEVACVLSQTT